MTSHSNDQYTTRGRPRMPGYWFLLTLLIVSLIGAFFIVRPYLHSIVLAAVLASVFYPLYTWLLAKTNQRENVASILACTVVALLVVVPLTIFTASLVDRGISSFKAVTTWVEDDQLQAVLDSERVKQVIDAPLIQRLRETRDQVPFLKSFNMQKLEGVAASALTWIVEKLKSLALTLVEGIGAIIINFLLMLFVMFYFFRDGRRIIEFLIRVSPLPTSHERRLIERIKVVSKSAVLGTFLTGLAQGVLGMIAFAFVGIPWFFWGVLMAFASLIPLVGTALIWVPCVIYLIISGSTGGAIFLFLWCAIIVNSADNFLRPFLMQGDTGLSSLILFFAIIGGINVFGVLGVIYGPILFGLCAVLLWIYESETRPPPRSRNRNRGRRRGRGGRGGRSADDAPQPAG